MLGGLVMYLSGRAAIICNQATPAAHAAMSQALRGSVTHMCCWSLCNRTLLLHLLL